MSTHNIYFYGELRKNVPLNTPVFRPMPSLTLFIPRHTIVAGYYGITLDVHVTVHQSYVHPSVHPIFVTRW